MNRLVWPPGAIDPVSSGFVPFAASGDSPEVWHANSRGDVLMLDESRALVVDATGAQAPLTATVPPGDSAKQVTGAIGGDGSAAVAWVAERPDDGQEEPMAWLRVRPPGGQFGPLFTLASPGPVRQIAVEVGTGGHIEVIHAFWDGARHVLVHTDVGADAVPGSSITVAATPAATPFLLGLVAGGPGIGRVVFAGNEQNAAGTRAIALTRTSSTAWGSRQVLEPGSGDALGVVGPLGGGAVMAYNRGRRMLVRRAPPGAPFGSAQRAGQVPRDWLAADYTLASNLRGDLLLAWREFSDIEGADCGGASCFDRVVAATAPAGGAFGPTQMLSPAGTDLGDAPIVAALSEQGRRLVAWLAADTDGSAPRALWLAMGDATADPRPRSDLRPPRANATVSRRALRTATRSGSLRIGLRCDEACAVRVVLYDSDSDQGIYDLRIVVLRRAKTTTTAWSLGSHDRRLLRRALDTGRPHLIGSATDAAGTCAGSAFACDNTMSRGQACVYGTDSVFCRPGCPGPDNPAEQRSRGRGGQARPVSAGRGRREAVRSTTRAGGATSHRTAAASRGPR